MTFSWENTATNQANKAVTESVNRVLSEEAARWRNDDNLRGLREASEANIALANKKALDEVNRKKANYEAGIVDPLETLAETKKLKEAQEATLTDYEQYDRKAALDLKNQSAAWADASKYRQSDAAQDFGAQKDRLVTDITGQKDRLVTDAAGQKDRLVTDITGQKDRLVANLDTQKEMQRAGFNQTNTLRRDDNQRAIDGFKMNF
jgi:mRNA-degrading endonuclease HigB of HigAB toxin-antitoxin module